MNTTIQGPQCLRPIGIAKPSPDQAQGNGKASLAHMWMLTVCTENMDCSFLFQDVYSLRVLPYTHRLGNFASLFSSAAYNKHTDCWCVTPSCTPFLHRCPLLHFLFPWLCQSLIPARLRHTVPLGMHFDCSHYL